MLRTDRLRPVSSAAPKRLPSISPARTQGSRRQLATSPPTATLRFYIPASQRLALTEGGEQRLPLVERLLPSRRRLHGPVPVDARLHQVQQRQQLLRGLPPHAPPPLLPLPALSNCSGLKRHVHTYQEEHPLQCHLAGSVGATRTDGRATPPCHSWSHLAAAAALRRPGPGLVCGSEGGVLVHQPRHQVHVRQQEVHGSRHLARQQVTWQPTGRSGSASLALPSPYVVIVVLVPLTLLPLLRSAATMWSSSKPSSLIDCTCGDVMSDSGGKPSASTPASATTTNTAKGATGQQASSASTFPCRWVEPRDRVSHLPSQRPSLEWPAPPRLQPAPPSSPPPLPAPARGLLWCT